MWSGKVHQFWLLRAPIGRGPEQKRLAGDTARAANTDEVKELRREAKYLKEVVAEQTLELRLLKKSMTGDGGDHE
jgi:transposase